VLGLVPARMGSSRFPGKPMSKICGVPMIEHVWRRCRMSRSLDHLYVATCDEEIRSFVADRGGQAVMTSARHERATERCAEALLTIERDLGERFDIIVMIQGDEPLVTPAMIDESLVPFVAGGDVEVANLMAEIGKREDHEDPNEVKVVVDSAGFALYFSRAPIPPWKDGAATPHLKQVCIIPFRRDFLLEYVGWAPTTLEIAESIDMNRVLERGRRVKMVPTTGRSISVDTLQDLRLVEAVMTDDPLFVHYAGSGA
jgi:3-deoxy-manno-octulosonate cytidylyltransferase (CMP-KDO synthetase)